ncbi:MAG TPA: hypothetical protein VIN40_01545 [Candidatus Tyrphobacter sp.]
MERSAAYSGILGALLFAASGVIPGGFPDVNASAALLAAFIGIHHTAVLASAWLALPAAAFILWFAYGLFDYLREPGGGDRALLQWGAAGAAIWTALLVASGALQAALVLHLGNDPSTLYVVDLILFVFSMGAFAMFAFAAANAARRNGALPGWLNALGFLVFVVDVLYTLTIFSSGAFSISGSMAIVAPALSAFWVLVASIVLLLSVPKAR